MGDIVQDRDHWYAEAKRLRLALTFCRDIAGEELPYAKIGTGAEVALRHIVRKAEDSLGE